MPNRRKRSASSRRWLAEHENDVYVQRSRDEGWRSRAIYKLEELDKKDRLLKPGQVVVDLGAAPGGWTQYVARRLKGRGTIVGIDILPMDPLDGAVCLEADFESEEGLVLLEETLNGAAVDLVLSDMAPNLTGVAVADQARSMALVELAADFAYTQLKPGGDFVSKVFQGEGFDPWMAELKRRFTRVSVRKPAASRDRSREVYAVARGLKAQST